MMQSPVSAPSRPTTGPQPGAPGAGYQSAEDMPELQQPADPKSQQAATSTNPLVDALGTILTFVNGMQQSNPQGYQQLQPIVKQLGDTILQVMQAKAGGGKPGAPEASSGPVQGAPQPGGSPAAPAGAAPAGTPGAGGAGASARPFGQNAGQRAITLS
jgi:hypothetical protein